MTIDLERIEDRARQQGCVHQRLAGDFDAVVVLPEQVDRSVGAKLRQRHDGDGAVAGAKD